MGRICAVKGCCSRQNDPVSFHAFPKNEEISRLWVQFCHKNVSKTAKVCSKHFADDFFKDHTDYSKGLHPNAYPTLINVQEYEDLEFLDDYTEEVQKSIRRDNLGPDSEIITWNLENGRPTRNGVTDRNGAPSRNEDLEYLDEYADEVQDSIAKKDESDQETAAEITWHPENEKPSRNGTPNRNEANTEVNYKLLYEMQKKKYRRDMEAARKDRISIQRQSNRRLKAMRSKDANIKIIKRKLKDSENELKLHRKNLAAIENNPFLNECLQNSQRHKNARRYKVTRLLAAKIKLASTAAYKTLRSSEILTLPHHGTVSRWQKNLGTSPGWNGEVFKRIKKSSRKMSRQDRTVALLIDGMSIRPSITYNAKTDRFYGFCEDGSYTCTDNLEDLATEAIVIMTKSIHGNFKQILGYFLAKGSLDSRRQGDLIREAVQKLKAIKLKTAVVIFDQHPTNIKMANELGASVTKPYFMVDGDKVIIMYDTPHLLKSVRNNLMAKNLLFNGEIVSFKWLQEFFEIDIKKNPRLAPRFTERCLIKHAFDKMRVGFAARVFSRTTSKAIVAYIKMDKLTSEAVSTAHFCKTMDTFFDVFNSSKKTDKVKPLRAAIGRNTPHWKFLKKLKPMFEQATFVPKDMFDPATAAQQAKTQLTTSQQYPPCLNGIVHNINALPLLWDLVESRGFKYLKMRRVNQDALENAFSIIRRSCGFNENPQAQQVAIALKCFAARKSLDAITGANCELHHIDEEVSDAEQDNVKYPSMYQEDGAVYVNTDYYDSGDTDDEVEGNPLETPYDFLFEPLDFDGELPALPELNGLAYVLGYAAGQIRHSSCKSKLSLDHESDEVNQDHLLFSRLKHHLNATGYTYPNKYCLTIGVNLLVAFEQKFVKFLKESKTGVKQRLKTYVNYEDYEDVICCKCFERFIDCILNTLIKGQIAKMMHSYNKRNSTERRSRRKKANRMGIQLGTQKTINGKISKRSLKPEKVLSKTKIKSILALGETGASDSTASGIKSAVASNRKRKSVTRSAKSTTSSTLSSDKQKPSSSKSPTTPTSAASVNEQKSSSPKTSAKSSKSTVKSSIASPKSIIADSLLSLDEYHRNDAELRKSIKELSAVLSNSTSTSNERLVKRNLYHLTTNDIIETFDEFSDDLTYLMTNFGSYEDRHINQQNGNGNEEDKFFTWDEGFYLLEDDQKADMAMFLEHKLVPEEDRGKCTTFITAVLVHEWSLRIFMKIYKFENRSKAIQYIIQQETEARENGELDYY